MCIHSWPPFSSLPTSRSSFSNGRPTTGISECTRNPWSLSPHATVLLSLQQNSMPGKFANAAAAGEFVDFSELLHVIDTGKGGEEPQVQLELTEGHHLALSKRPRKKGITSFAEWVLCFSVYANTFCAHNPHHATDMIGYLFLIASAVREYSLPAVVAYDVAFRRKVSTFKAIPWGQIDPALYSRAFTGPGKAKPHATCTSCLQAGHDQSDCPLYTDGSAKKVRGTVAGPRASAPISSTREVCRNFNRGQCAGNDCRRLHVCSVRGCAGPHALFRCPLKRASPRIQ